MSIFLAESIEEGERGAREREGCNMVLYAGNHFQIVSKQVTI